MTLELLWTPTQLRTNVKRLIEASERTDVFVSAIGDAQLVEQLVSAARRGVEVNVTTNLGTSTTPDAIRQLLEAGANVGVFEPAVHRRRPIKRFKPGVMIFDNEKDWWTAAVLGSFSATAPSLSEDLDVVTLLESDDFHDDQAGKLLLEVLDWGDSINHKPVDSGMLRRHRKAYEAARPPSRVASSGARIVEVKPEAVGYASPLSWQQIARCDWATYWSALLETDRRRGPRFKDSLCGPRGWLFGIEVAHRAYEAGLDAWTDETVREDLLGHTVASKLLGRVRSTKFTSVLSEDAEFRRALYDAVERCTREPGADSMRAALAPIIDRFGVSVSEVSRVLAAAAPDRFFSVLGETMQLRLSNIVGFDLTARPGALQDQLTRYVDAVEVIRRAPWAVATSVGRTSDHPREPDAWVKRVALLGCLIC